MDIAGRTGPRRTRSRGRPGSRQVGGLGRWPEPASSCSTPPTGRAECSRCMSRMVIGRLGEDGLAVRSRYRPPSAVDYGWRCPSRQQSFGWQILPSLEVDLPRRVRKFRWCDSACGRAIFPPCRGAPFMTAKLAKECRRSSRRTLLRLKVVPPDVSFTSASAQALRLTTSQCFCRPT